MFAWLKRFVLVLGIVTMGASAWAVDVNSATATQLQEIKGIGPVVAERIVKERSKGKFASWADLQDRVKGIADGKSKQFSKAGLTVGKASYKGLKAKKKTTTKKAAAKKTTKATSSTKKASEVSKKTTKSKGEKKAKSDKKKTGKKMGNSSEKKAKKTNK